MIPYIEEKPDMLSSAITYLNKNQKTKLLKHFCCSGDLKYIKYLVSHGADIHSDHELALFMAMRHGRLDIVQYLVSEGADIHAQDGYPLCVAILNRHLDIVKYLVSQGANMYIDDESPLWFAVHRNYAEIAKYLVSEGADINYLNPNYQHRLKKLLNN